MRELDTVRTWIDTARTADQTVVVLTGAGISTDSGIADYRGPNGVWTKNPEAERMATLDAYLSDADLRKRSWQSRLTSPIWDALPNDGHRALAKPDPKPTVITQNVDGLHQKAGTPPTQTIELHGSAWHSRCWQCRDERPMDQTLDRVRGGEADPPCLVCGGILKSATISFGENLDRGVLDRASRATQDATVFIALGSTLQVHPAASLVPLARRTAQRVIIANAEPTPYDSIADVVFRDPLSELLPAMFP